MLQSIANANTYAGGQSIAGAASGVEDWWQKRANHLIDYVFVSNVMAQSKQLRPLMMVVNKEIALDQEKKARKIKAYR